MSDVIVVGGGPAGATLALRLGQAGFGVTLFDQSRFPRDKPCGEGLMPGGVEVLRSLGLEAAVGGRPLRGVCYHVGSGAVRAGFESALARRCHGLGQRRLRLDAALWQAAAATANVTAYEEACVEAPVLEHGRIAGVLVGGQVHRAACVVAADGANSRLRRKLGLESCFLPRRVGLRAHFSRAADQPPLHDVQIFVRPGYEFYVTPLPGREVLVALLAHQDAVSSNLKLAFQRWRDAEPLLCRWLEGAQQISELAGRAPLLRKSKRRNLPPGLVLLGDAATSVDPITAGGMSLALVSAELLAAHLPEMLGGSRAAGHRFECARAKAVWIHRSLGALLLELGLHPRAAVGVRTVMQRYPALMNLLVKLASTRVSS